ncbi:MAG: hypothetical protein HUU50_02095 [Candidatus Brocadiae bacterium]|nr:hypothetical protein [Candidatus Brocadiia bacterium]
MKFFYPSRMENFFVKHDMNQVFQEVTSALIGVFAGLYAYEKREEFFGLLGVEGGKPFSLSWPEAWTRPENKTFFTYLLVFFLFLLLIKLLLYLRFLDLNSLSLKKGKKSAFLDINSILQEITTVVLGMTFGIFSSPVTKSTWLGMGSRQDYPNPIPGAVVIFICLILKLLLYSKTINLNSLTSKKNGKIVAPEALGIFLQKADWNIAMKEVLSTLIGIGFGLYLYQSNLIFLPGEMMKDLSNALSQLDQKIGSPARKIGNTFGLKKYTDQLSRSTGEISRTAEQVRKVKLVPEIKEENKKYWIVGLIVVIASILLKWMMYMAILNFNKIRDSFFSTRGAYRQSMGKDYNGIVDETVVFLITSLLGVMADPIYNNLRGNQAQYPYGYWSLFFLIFLILVKLMLVMEILDFQRSSGTQALKRKR